MVYITLLRSGTIVRQTPIPKHLIRQDAEEVCAIVDSLIEAVDPDLEYEVTITEDLQE